MITNFVIVQDDEQSFVSRMISGLASYHGGIVPSAGHTGADEEVEAKSGCKPKKKKGPKKPVFKFFFHILLLYLLC